MRNNGNVIYRILLSYRKQEHKKVQQYLRTVFKNYHEI